MHNKKLDDEIRPSSFGRRKIMPRACVADGKQHIRTFLADALEELGFITCECAQADQLTSILDMQLPDLVVLGLSADGLEAGKIFEILAAAQFDGKVLPVGPRESILVTAARQCGDELGIPMLPTLPTPFSAGTLRESLAMLLPTDVAPSPAVDVAEALKAGWLELWYQHKINARTLAPCGAEALIRMRHPAWGVVPPASFIPDDSDPNFRALSEFVVGRALDDWRYFVEQQGPVDISINLPVSFLEDRQVIRYLCQQMPQHPAFGGLLIEVKGADVIDNLDLVIDVARQVRFHNIALSIDNLGVDWPSLMDLDAFPFVELKVDRQFINGCADDRLKQSVCRRIIDLADGYGARTVAEGVETRPDFLAAHEMGFDLVQGFLFGKPMGAKKFARSTQAHPVLVSR